MHFNTSAGTGLTREGGGYTDEDTGVNKKIGGILIEAKVQIRHCVETGVKSRKDLNGGEGLHVLKKEGI